MNCLCVGGGNDGKLFYVSEEKREGDTVTVGVREKMPEIIDGDEWITYRAERYELRFFHFPREGRIPLLVSTKITTREAFKRLVTGYKPEGGVVERKES